MKLTDEQVPELISTLRVWCEDQGWWAVGSEVDDACDVIERLTRERDEAREACAMNNDTHSRISADYTQTIRALEALLASFDEERLEEIITDSIDLAWTPRTAATAIVRAMKGGGMSELIQPFPDQPAQRF